MRSRSSSFSSTPFRPNANSPGSRHSIQGDDARRFVALEDWINDGVPLSIAGGVRAPAPGTATNEPGAKDCGGSRAKWVRPQSLRRPVLAVGRGRDRIVPGFAEPLCSGLRRRDRAAAPARA